MREKKLFKHSIPRSCFRKGSLTSINIDFVIISVG